MIFPQIWKFRAIPCKTNVVDSLPHRPLHREYGLAKMSFHVYLNISCNSKQKKCELGPW